MLYTLKFSPLTAFFILGTVFANKFMSTRTSRSARRKGDGSLSRKFCEE